jgi:hypothetical protein
LQAIARRSSVGLGSFVRGSEKDTPGLHRTAAGGVGQAGRGLKSRRTSVPSILTSSRSLIAGAICISALGFVAPAIAQAPTKESVTTIISSWPAASQKAAKEMMEKYGAPQEATASHIMWRNNGPWLWTRIDIYETPHEFPAMHTDVMEQAINYRIDAAKADEIVQYDGSVYLRRTEGVMSARCDLEGANFLAINLANDVSTGKKTVNSARDYYAKAIKEFKASGKMDPYMTKLQFQAPKSMQGDKDKPAA